MSEVGFFDEAAALKWQIMRMEGVMAASLNNTGSAIMELASRLQELAERQEAAGRPLRCSLRRHGRPRGDQQRPAARHTDRRRAAAGPGSAHSCLG